MVLLCNLDMSSFNEARYGHDLRKKSFLLFEGLVNLNHGSFGTVPKPVFEAQTAIALKQESCPELWFREWYQVYINESRQAAAALVKSKVEDVVLVENASYAINSVVGSFPFNVSFCVFGNHTKKLNIYILCNILSIL